MEDDGVSFEYENGSVAKTKIDCADTERSTEITIHSVEGNYKGMPQNRTWELEVLSAKKPTRVLVNSSKIDDWKYENGAVCFKVVQEAPDKKLTVELQK